MKSDKLAGMLLLWIILGGCSGQIYTVTKAKPENRGNAGEFRKGIRAYPPKLFLEVYEFRAYVQDGKLLRTTAGDTNDTKCESNRIENIVTRPDYSDPYDLVYEPGFLESREFSLTLKDGMLTAINIKSTPDRGETLHNFLPTIADFSGTPMGLAAPDVKVLCNANPVLLEIKPHTP